ncbi:hypothetical protein GR157_04000 [Burkholderia sp. 4701]|nr:hypothetical protein [Burkholderia sp. 4701]MXN81014.1 hypothetical protein [Burkholderia sp. 4812]
MRVFQGIADDDTPMAPCRAYVARPKAAGKDIRLTEYARAAHVFDGRAFSLPLKPPKAQTTRATAGSRKTTAGSVNTDTGQPFSYADARVERGATVGYDAKAAADARNAVAAFVTETPRPAAGKQPSAEPLAARATPAKKPRTQCAPGRTEQPPPES